MYNWRDPEIFCAEPFQSNSSSNLFYFPKNQYQIEWNFYRKGNKYFISLFAWLPILRFKKVNKQFSFNNQNSMKSQNLGYWSGNDNKIRTNLYFAVDI